MDRFTAMATFVRVVETQSLSAAARSIPMSLTSVSRQIAGLEQQLGSQLLLRTTRRLALTDHGRLFYDRAKAILAEVRDLELALSAGRAEPSGRLRVSAPTLMGRLLLTPLLPDFLQQYPGVSIDLLLVDRPVSLIDEGIDLAIHVGRLADSPLIARKLAEVRMILCAAPAYLARRGTPQTPGDLAPHDCLAFSGMPGLAEWRFRDASLKLRIPGRLLANSLDALVLAAIAGAGIARVPSWQVAAEMAAGKLVEILPSHANPPTPVHMLFQPGRLAASKIRLFADHISAGWDFRTVGALARPNTSGCGATQ